MIFNNRASEGGLRAKHAASVDLLLEQFQIKVTNLLVNVLKRFQKEEKLGSKIWPDSS